MGWFFNNAKTDRPVGGPVAETAIAPAAGYKPAARPALPSDEVEAALQARRFGRLLQAPEAWSRMASYRSAVNTAAQYHVTNKRERSIDRQFCEVTMKVIGKEICEPTVAISVMKQPQSELGSFKLPERSAVRVAAELSHMIPEAMAKDVLIQELEITSERARVSGETSSFDAVDQIVAARCYGEVAVTAAVSAKRDMNVGGTGLSQVRGQSRDFAMMNLISTPMIVAMAARPPPPAANRPPFPQPAARFPLVSSCAKNTPQCGQLSPADRLPGTTFPQPEQIFSN